MRTIDTIPERLSSVLRREVDPIWKGIFDNPFLEELQNGTLPLEKFRYYLAQDYLYLEAFARAVALALARAPESTEMALLAPRISTPVERSLHRALMPLAGLTEEAVEATKPAPTNLAYMNHMTVTAARGSLGETAAALLPCPWSYHEIGKLLGPVRHPVFSRWAAPYLENFLEESTAAWRELVDHEARRGSDSDRSAMSAAFHRSSRYEHMFWRMAYQQESWPV